MTINSYYYAQQFKNYIMQFANIFAGMQVMTGKNADGVINELQVPIVYGSKDKVVASIGAGNTQNRLHTLPIMSCYLQNVEPNPERRKGIGGINRQKYMKQGGVFPEDVKVSYQLMPYPYDLMMDLSIWTSNTDQAFQILEQILIVFDPTLEIQTSNAPLDWTKISKVELLSLANEENHPQGSERRMIIWTLSFKVDAWLTPPMEIRDNIIKRIVMQFGDLDGFSLYEYDQNGEPQPFADGSLWTTSVLDAPPIDINNDPTSQEKLEDDENNNDDEGEKGPDDHRI
jgi:hypothetical protein